LKLKNKSDVCPRSNGVVAILRPSEVHVFKWLFYDHFCIVPRLHLGIFERCYVAHYTLGLLVRYL
jgi:hypothetical protein